MDTQGRNARLAAALTEAGIDAFLAHSPVSIGYLHGFHENFHERFATLATSAHGEVRAIVPALAETQLRRAGVTEIATWKDGDDPLACFAELSQAWGLEAGIVAVDTTLPAHMLLAMQSALPATLFRDGRTLLGPVMAAKTDEEIDLLRRAGKIADDAFAAVLPRIKAGLTERQVEQMLLEAMTVDGAEPYFAIIGTGSNGAEPHHLTDDTVLKTGDVVILDFGCNLHGYKSDITRTICIGQASDDAKRVYELVYRAHMAARQAIVPGASGQDIDRAARQVIEDGGHGAEFFHRTGHGIGMNGHEDPYIVEGNTIPLASGNTFSIEPGIYLAGQFGVRIENIVAATATGHESLNVDPSPTLIEI